MGMRLGLDASSFKATMVVLPAEGFKVSVAVAAMAPPNATAPATSSLQGARHIIDMNVRDFSVRQDGRRAHPFLDALDAGFR